MAAVESRFFASNYINEEMDFEEEPEETEDNDEREESDEDTEEASETENRRSEAKDSKDQIYLEKLNLFKSHLKQLLDGTNHDYLRRIKPLEQKYRERLRINDVWRKHQIELMEKDFIVEKCAASKELEEKQIELKDSLLQEMEEKRRCIEAERTSMELSGDCAETKPAVTRKLRRRPNDPTPLPDKRRGKMASLPSQINFMLDEKDIESDLKAIQRSSKNSIGVRKSGPMPSNGVQPIIPNSSSDKFGDGSQGDTRIEDGKLLYERRWFHRGQPVYVEGRDLPKFPAIISSICSEAVIVKKTVDASKIKINLNQLIKGKVSIKRRAS